MYLCYIDESGTPDIPGNTSHYMLAGIAIPVWHWQTCERDIDKIKMKYDLVDEEIHVAWMLRTYLGQSRIPDFENLAYHQRRRLMKQYRAQELYRLQRANNPRQYKQTKKNFRKTSPYIHLTREERYEGIERIAQVVSQWRFARIFAECVDKLHFDPERRLRTVDEQAFEQVVSRFEHFLRAISTPDNKNYGILIHDNNETVARRHTALMKRFHQRGTLWTDVNHIIETPLFVDSALTGMVQIADLAAYALRRYLENGESKLFELIFTRADKRQGAVVGVRHFTHSQCRCQICEAHRVDQVRSV